MAASSRSVIFPSRTLMFKVGSLLRLGSIIVWILHLVACMGGCLGSWRKQELMNSNEPPRGPKFQDRRVSKPSISDDFWTTSPCDMDNSAVLSRGSISSISTSTLPIDPHGTSSGNTPSEFVNHGRLLWNHTRQQWIGTKKPNIHTQQLHEPKISWNATYESLLGSNKPFSQRISLPEMIDFLADIWEQEGLYD